MSEPLRCCVCLDGFRSPVFLPCGHRFCLGCIGEYWRLHRLSQCPLCRAHFPTLPQLKVDRIDGESQDIPAPLKAGEVSCDVCPAGQRAVRSCVQCLASYCAAHLEPHYQNEALGRHLLLKVVKNLEGSVCGLHGKQLKQFCRSDRTCICITCAQTDHRGHHVISIKREAAKKRIRLKWRKIKLQQAIQERVDQLEKLKDAEQKRQLEGEVRGLQRSNAVVEQLMQIEDNLHLLQRFVHTDTSQ